jgi:hypothetical protein|tara:strand:- start:2678 stop:3046 length:369 start_codon:yes stop_codon:yes gene_type:complete
MATSNNVTTLGPITTSGHTISTLTSGNSIITGANAGIYTDANTITNGMTVNGDLNIGTDGTLLVQVDGESVDVSEKLSETEMLLGIMTNLLDTLIKDNPGITSAKSIEELIDQGKMMKKLSK